MTERVKGFLKWFDREKGYGFITSNGTDYFIHISQLSGEIFEGDNVEFEIKQTEKGFSAINCERSIGELDKSFGDNKNLSKTKRKNNGEIK